jgi:hypothetical protein
MMGIGKNEAVYPKALRKVIGQHLRFVYSSIYPELENDFDSRIIEIFGSKYSGINIGMYALIAKLLDEVGALNMDQDIDAADPEKVKRYLGDRGISNVAISFIVDEMGGASTLARVMDRMRKCSAGRRMPKLAALIPPECTTFEELEDGGLQCCIKAVSKTLQKNEQEVFRALMRIKNAQERLCDRNRLVNSLAKQYNGIDGNDDEKKAALVELTDFIRFIKDHNIGQEDAIKLIKNTADAYRQTFWDNCKLLEEYHTQHGKHDIVEIEGVRILTVNSTRDDGNDGDYLTLYNWVNTQNGYLDAQTESGEHRYGVKAYKRPGSLEYLALVGLDVCFIPDLNRQAIEIRQSNDVARAEDASGDKGMMMGWLNM